MPPGKPRIVFLDRATISVPVKAPAWPHEWENFDATGPAEVADRIADAEVVIVNKVELRRETIERASRLSLVLIAATGTDNVDTAALDERNIVWHNVVGYGATSVTEHVMALILTLRRNIIAYRQAVLGGRWQQAGEFCFHDFPVAELEGATLAIIGGGAIGQRVGQLTRAFGMRIVLAERKGRPARPGRTAFEDALANADVISLHCPLTDETRHLLDDAAFCAMNMRPFIINTARGALIDTAALVRALDTGRIGGAGLDVLEAEPALPDDPIMAVTDRPNVVVTPHIAWAGQHAQNVVARTLRARLDAWWARRG